MGLTKVTYSMIEGASVNVLDFGAVNDGVTDCTVAIQAAITNAYTNGNQLYWPEGDYLTSSNLTNFWDIVNIGPGKVIRSTDTFYITPSDLQTNVIYVGASGSATNDGLSSSQPTTIATAIDALRGIKDKALDGVWRIQMLAGAYSDAGQYLASMPVFRNRLQIFGVAADLTSVPTTVWTRSTSTAWALRSDVSVGTNNNTAVMNLHLKNIKFVDWDTGGAVQIWGPSDVLIENCHADNCADAFYYRQGYVRQLYGTISNSSSVAIRSQYGLINVGNLSGGGVTFNSCGTGVQSSRNNGAAIQGCTFVSMTNYAIECSWNSRVEHDGNDYSGIGSPSGILSNTQEAFVTPTTTNNTYPTLSTSLPAINFTGGVHTSLQTFSPVSTNSISHDLVEIENASGVQTLLSGINPSWIPFRLPSWAMYCENILLDLNVVMLLPTGAAGELALHGASNSSTVKLASITIPAVGSNTRGSINFKVSIPVGTSQIRAEVQSSAFNYYDESATVSANSSSIRTNSDDIINYRLYWTPADNLKATFYSMRSKIEV